MKHRGTIVGLALLLAGGGGASGQEILDIKGTWHPADGAHIVEGPSRHSPSGTEDVLGNDTLKQHTSKFVFRFDGQEGRTFWGELASDDVSEKLIGTLSVDGRRFVIVDEDGTFDGIVVDDDTLDYCYSHVTPTDRAVACGLLVREK